mgnify:FL=1
MPGDTGMTYPFPYKTGDGEENVKISNLIVTGTEVVEGAVTIRGPTLIENNTHITQNLTVDGNFSSGTNTSGHFIATDATNQYRVSTGSVFDFVQSNSVTPTFNFKNSLGSTNSSTLNTDNVVTRNVTASTGGFQSIQSNDIVSNNLTSTNGTVTHLISTDAFVDEISTKEMIVYQSTTPMIDVSVSASRGIIRTLEDAFGMDIAVQGLNKSIKLTTDDTIRVHIEDTTITIPTETESTDENTGAMVVKGGMGIQGNVHIRDNWTFEQLKFSFTNVGIELMTITPGSMDLLGGDLNVTVGTITCEAGQIRTNAGNIVAGRTLGLGGTVEGYIVKADNYLQTNNILLKSAGGLNYDFILPNAMGTSGKALTSGGSGSSTTWQQFIQKITLNVPSFLTVSGSPVDNVAEGTITIGGSTTGTGVIVLNNAPTINGLTVTGVATLTSCSISGTLNVSGVTTLGTTTAVTLTVSGVATFGTMTAVTLTVSGIATLSTVTAVALTVTGLSVLATVTAVTATVTGALTVVGLSTLGAVLSGSINAGNVTCLALQSTNLTTGAVQAGNVLCGALQSTNLTTGAVECGAVTSALLTAAGIVVPTGSVNVLVGNINCEIGSITCPIGTVSAGALGSGCTMDNFGTFACHQINCDPYLGIGGLINCAFLRCIKSPLPVGSGDIVAEGWLTTEDTTNSTSTTTGALRSSGGLAVALDVYVGEDVHIEGTLYGTAGELVIGDDVQVTASLKCVQELDVQLDNGDIGQQLYNTDVDGSYHLFNCYYDGTGFKATSIETVGAFYKDQDYLSLIGTNVNPFATYQTLLSYWKTNLNDGDTTFTENVLINKTITTGVAAGQSGKINFKGLTSGTVSMTVPSVAGTYDFILPITPGTTGQVLTSAGGSSAMTWSSAAIGSVTSVALVVPSFLTVTGSPITTSGTFTVSLSGTALPVLNGGTGVTTSTGTGSVVLSTSPTLVTPVLGIASGTSLTLSSTVSATQLISTIAIGTAPLTVTSTTVVPNLNVSQLLGNTWAIPGTIGSTTPNTGSFTTLTLTTLQGSGTIQGANDKIVVGPTGSQNAFFDRNRTGGNFIFGYQTAKDTVENARFQVFNNQTDANLLLAVWSKGSVSGTDRVQTACPIYVTVTTGTAPFSILSTTVVPNLNVSQLLGGTWAIPGAIGSTTPTTGAFTTLTASSTITGTQLVSTIAIGTAPITVTSTTVVPNLNVSQLLGNTWTIPGTIGSTTPNTGSFTTLTLTTLQGSGTIQGANDKIVVGPTGSQNAFFDRNRTGGTFIFGYQTAKDTIENARFQVYNNQTDANMLLGVYSKGSSSGTDHVDINTILNVSSNIMIGGNNSLVLIGSSSGSVSIKPNTTGTAWNFVMPNSAGTSGQVLASGAGSTCTWTSSPTFSSPVLGTATATSITCTTLSTATLNGTGTTTLAGDTLLIGPTGQDNLFIDRNIAGGNFIWGYNTARLTTEHFIHQWYNNATDRNLLMYITSKGSSSGTNRIGLNALTIVSHASVVLANFYPSTTGPASITVQSNAAGSKVLEMGVANINTEFSTSSLAGDGIIRNSTGGRVLVQSGTGAAALTIGSGGVYFGTSTYAYTYRYDGMTVSLGVDTGSLGTVTITQNICQIVSCGYSCTVLVSVEGSFTGGSSWTNLYIMLSSFTFGSSFIQKTPAWVQDMPGTNGSQTSYCQWAPNGSNPKLYLINNNSLVSSASTSGSFKIYSNGVVINF